MRIRWDESEGYIDIDGVKISAQVLREIVDPDKRVLLRFRKGDTGLIEAAVYDESNVIWIDRDDGKASTIQFGAEENQEG